MKSIAVFNNKSGIGKTTLTYHLGCALAELGHKTLLVDLDPQSNLTLLGLDLEKLHDIWQVEDAFIDDFVDARAQESSNFENIASDVRSIHFLLKPTEDGADSPESLAKPLELLDNLGMIPGRLSIHTYEYKIASRWTDVYGGDLLAIRTVTQIRNFCEAYAEKYAYDYVVIDTSPSLGILNKAIISTVDGFLIPCMPDMFSLYGIQNIGKSLKNWKRDFDTIYTLLSDAKLSHFPKNFASFLGFTIFNASKYSSSRAHHNYPKQIPATIEKYIDADHRKHLTEAQLEAPVGGTAIMLSYSRLLMHMFQKYRTPMWKVPSCENLEKEDRSTILGNRKLFEKTQKEFHNFAEDLLIRLDRLEVDNG